MTAVEAPGRALLNLSGGLDSALCMYQQLAAGRRLLVHHIRLRSPEGRVELEQRAVEAILAWHHEQGLTRFAYVESGFDYGTIRRQVRDHSVWSFMTGVILSDPQHADIESVIIPRHANSFSHIRQPAAAEARSNQVVTTLVPLLAGREPRYEFPLAHMSKLDIVAALPPELLALCWWCRRPQRDRPCHRCQTCLQVDNARRRL